VNIEAAPWVSQTLARRACAAHLGVGMRLLDDWLTWEPKRCEWVTFRHPWASDYHV